MYFEVIWPIKRRRQVSPTHDRVGLRSKGIIIKDDKDEREGGGIEGDKKGPPSFCDLVGPIQVH